MALPTQDLPDSFEDDEISLTDILAFAQKHIYWIVGMALVGLITGLGLAWLTHKQWEADAILQVGQIQYADHGAQPTLIEPVAQTVERVKSQSFQDTLLKGQNQDPVDESAPLVKLVRKSLSAKPVPNTSLVQLSVRGFSPDQAKAILQAALNQVVATHTSEAASILQDFQNRLAEVNKELGDNAVQLNKLNAALAQRAQAGATAKSTDDALLLGLLNKVSEQRQDLTQRKNGLEEQLNPSRSFISKPMGDIEVSPRPVYPKPAIFAGIGLVLGLLAGCFIGWVRHMRPTAAQA